MMEHSQSNEYDILVFDALVRAGQVFVMLYVGACLTERTLRTDDPCVTLFVDLLEEL